MNPVGFSFALTIADRNWPFSASTLKTAKISSTSFRNASLSPILRSVSYFSIRAGGACAKLIRNIPSTLTTRPEGNFIGCGGCCAEHEQQNEMATDTARSFRSAVGFTASNIAKWGRIEKENRI